MSPRRVLVVGTGCTGAILSSLLGDAMRSGELAVTMWDKARGPGGRMNTTRRFGRFRAAGADGARAAGEAQAATCTTFCGDCAADLGAQYISRWASTPAAVNEHLNRLVEAGVLSRMTGAIAGVREAEAGATAHYAAPGGMSSVVEHYLARSTEAGAAVTYRSQLVRLEPTEPPAGSDAPAWRATDAAGTSSDFDAVVLTMPTPQVLALEGGWQQLLSQEVAGTGLPTAREVLASARFSSRYALALLYTDPPAVQHAARLAEGAGWAVKYVDGDPCIRYLAWDHLKRGNQRPSFTSLVVHTSVPYGLSHLEDDVAAVQADVEAHVKALMPDLPPHQAARIIRWRYSQASSALRSTTQGVVVLSGMAAGKPQPFLAVAGDGLAGSAFEGCVVSATATAERLLRWGTRR